MRRWRIGCLGVALLWLGLSTGAARAQTLYGITWNNQLITINPMTGAGTLVGPLSSNMNPPGLGFRGTKLYTWDANANLIRQLDPATGATINSLNIGLVGANGGGDVTFRSDGIGFLAPALPASNLISFNVTVPSSTVVGALNPAMYGLAFNSAGVFYGLELGAAALYTINPNTGATTLVANTGLPFQWFGGMAFDSKGNLFAALGPNVGPGSLYQINPSTGAVTLVGNIGFNGVTGIAFLPVPPSPPPPPLPPSGSEGSFAGAADPPNAGSEGCFGSGGHLAAQTLPGAAGLLGPFLVSGNSLYHAPPSLANTPPAGASLLVFNAPAPQQASGGSNAPGAASAGASALAWTLLAGLSLAALAAWFMAARGGEGS